MLAGENMTTLHNAANRTRQAGFNLIEVMIAMAILGSVMMSILTLFFLSRQSIYSGKQMTQALAVATRVLEDLSAMTEDDVFSSFGITDATPTTSPTIGTIATAYTNVIVRDTNTTSPATDPSGYLASWKTLLTADKFTNAKITLIIMPSGPPIAQPITTSNFCKVRILIEWNEATRKRQTFIDTSKVKRP